MMSRTWLCRIAASAVGLLIAISAPGVQAWEQLTVLQPDLTAEFGKLQTIYSKPSLFGLPNYQKSISGQVIYPEATTNGGGCSPYAAFFDLNDPTAAVTLIALIDRDGNCTFAAKALNAQNAGASAIIIVNDDVMFPGSLPYMAGGSTANTAPAMLIYGTAGSILKKHVGDVGGLSVSMSYFLPNPDDRVEFDFFTSGVDTLSDTFKRQFAEVTTSLGTHALFTPHYQVFNGDYDPVLRRPVSCVLTGPMCTVANLNNRCGNHCTNCGRYCQHDPDKDTRVGASGSDVVMEQVRQKCVWKYANDTAGVSPSLWFDYVNQHALYCVNAPNAWDKGCSEQLAHQLGVPQDYLTNCVGDMGFTTDKPVAMAEDDLAFEVAFQPMPPPQLYVNNQQYHGSLGCPDPIGTTCPALSMICAGFLDGTAPSTCQTSPGCPLSQVFDDCGVCGGDGDSCRNHSKSFPAGAVIGIIIAACALIGAGVWFYMRKQNTAMKNDIDELLKQYLPLDGVVPSGGRQVDQTRLMSGVDPSEP